MSVEHLRYVQFWAAVALMILQAFVPAIAEWTHLSAMATASITSGLTLTIAKLALDLPPKDEANSQRTLRRAILHVYDDSPSSKEP